MKNRISKDWQSWITTNTNRGVSKELIFNTLLENGFSYSLVCNELGYEPEIKQHLPEKWRTWLKENLLLNKNKDGLFKILLMNGFSFDAIREEMNYLPSIPVEQLIDPADTNRQIESQIKTLRHLQIPNIHNAVKLQTENLAIFCLENFLNKRECDHLIKLIRKKLRPSKLSSPNKDQFFRTSKTCDLAQFDDEVTKEVDRKICSLIGVNHKFSEPMQGQYYEEGQEFKPHTDFFENNELVKNNPELGQRTFTVMIYLNSTRSGGETTFPLIKESFSPKRGRAIIWSNLNTDYSTNYFSLHHANKVRSGFKSIITKWFRTGIPSE